MEAASSLMELLEGFRHPRAASAETALRTYGTLGSVRHLPARQLMTYKILQISTVYSER